MSTTATFADFISLANQDLDFVATMKLDNRFQSFLTEKSTHGFPVLRLAILAAATMDHLLPAIRVGALRRGVVVECYLAPFDQIQQELLVETSGCYAFKPDVVLVSCDSLSKMPELPLAASEEVIQKTVVALSSEWARAWDVIQNKLNAVVVQSTFLTPPLRMFGEFDARVPASPFALVQRLNATLRAEAAKKNVLLLDIDSMAMEQGIAQWFDVSLWHHAKQMISPVAAPLFGKRVGQILGAVRGTSKKCLVLDLDNVLWGGVVGDDGVQGLVFGQGDAVGEAFLAFQRYVKRLKEAGVLLAVCSKNDESVAREVFEKRSDMPLKLNDFSIFVANWNDKATNMEFISKQLNIGLDSLVFFDDNPAERELIRQKFPVMAVPEVPVDPSGYVDCLSQAGFFEAAQFSSEDANRSTFYASNAQRTEAANQAHDITDFLKSLEMELEISRFDDVGVARISQLINKSNQYNLTTRRYTDAQVRRMVNEPNLLTYQARLKDKFGDNGMISVIIAKPFDDKSLVIDTWLMSCRVLGRQVEHNLLNSLVADAKRAGYKKIIGEYIPTDKNHMVQALYPSFGFKAMSPNGHASLLWELDLGSYTPFKTFIKSI